MKASKSLSLCVIPSALHMLDEKKKVAIIYIHRQCQSGHKKKTLSNAYLKRYWWQFPFVLCFHFWWFIGFAFFLSVFDWSHPPNLYLHPPTNDSKHLSFARITHEINSICSVCRGFVFSSLQICFKWNFSYKFILFFYCSKCWKIYFFWLLFRAYWKW